MPAYYPPRATASQLPLTPPDSGSGYYTTMQYTQDPYLAQIQSQPRQDSTFEYGYPAPAAAAPSYYDSYDAFKPLGAPILPPLRINDRYADAYQRQLQEEQQQAAVAREQQQARQAPKEEKATGGVSAKLDYDLERMTDFVTEATQTIFQHTMQSPPSFRKWVHQVLSATRLPSATILLSLHYLNDRVAHFPETVSAGENQIYRLLAVALILGSKFLDDNTFINRSWSDVTAIKVTELNQLEITWLHLIRYELHIDPDAPNGLSAWLAAWEDYKHKHMAKQQLPARLSPLDTNVHRHSGHRDRYSPYPSTYSAATSARSHDAARSSQAYSATPYTSADPWASAVDSSQAFDDFYKRQHRYPTLSEIDDVNRRASEERARQYAYTQPSYYQAPVSAPAPTSAYPTSTSTWDYSQAWNAAHRPDCACQACVYQQHYRPYPMHPSYSAQTVMG